MLANSNEPRAARPTGGEVIHLAKPKKWRWARPIAWPRTCSGTRVRICGTPDTRRGADNCRVFPVQRMSSIAARCGPLRLVGLILSGPRGGAQPRRRLHHEALVMSELAVKRVFGAYGRCTECEIERRYATHRLHALRRNSAAAEHQICEGLSTSPEDRGDLLAAAISRHHTSVVTRDHAQNCLARGGDSGLDLSVSP